MKFIIESLFTLAEEKLIIEILETHKSRFRPTLETKVKKYG